MFCIWTRFGVGVVGYLNSCDYFPNMFKNLRKKITEEVGQPSMRLPVQQLSQLISGDSPRASHEADLSAFSLDDEGSAAAAGAPGARPSVPGRLRRGSAASSTVSESPAAAAPLRRAPLHADLESGSEVSSVADLGAVSKEQLLHSYQRMRAKYNKYRGRYTDLARAFHNLENDNEKMRASMAEAEGRAGRRLAELREQCQLEQQAKAHMEEALRTDLEERDELVKLLTMKVKLLREGADEEPAVSPGSDQNGSAGQTAESAAETLQLRAKIRQQEELLGKCRDSIQQNVTRAASLSAENEQLRHQLTATQEAHRSELERLEAVVTDLRQTMSSAQQQQQESAMTTAEQKAKMHQELELKEAQVRQLQEDAESKRKALEQLQSRVATLETETSQLRETHRHQLEEVERVSEEEKAGLVQELSRAKQEALRLLEQELEARLAEQWGRRLQLREDELRAEIREKDDQLQLAAETEQLQREAAAAGREQPPDDSTADTIDALRAEQVALEARLRQAEQARDEARECLQQANKDAEARLEQSRREAEAKLEEVRKEADAKIAEAEELQTRLNAAKAELDAKAEQVVKEVSNETEAQNEKVTEEIEVKADQPAVETATVPEAQLEEVRAQARLETESQLEEARKEAEARLEKAQKDADARVEEAEKAADARVEEAKKAADARLEEVQSAADARVKEAEETAKKAADARVEEAEKVAEAKVEEATKTAQEAAELRIEEAKKAAEEAANARAEESQKAADARLEEAEKAAKEAADACLEEAQKAADVRLEEAQKAAEARLEEAQKAADARLEEAQRQAAAQLESEVAAARQSASAEYSARLESQSQAGANSAAEHEAVVSELRAQLEAERRHSAETSEERRRLERRMEQLSGVVRSLEESLGELSNKYEAESRSAAALAAERDRLNGQLGGERQQRDDQLAELRAQLELNAARLGDFSSQAAALSDAKRGLEEKVAALSAAADADRQRAEQALAERERELAELRQRAETAEQARDERDAQKTELDEALRTARSELESTVSDLSDIDEMSEGFRPDVQRLSAEVSRLQTKLHSQKQRADQLQDSNEKLTSRLLQMEKIALKVELVENENQNLKGELAFERERGRKHRDRVKVLKSLHAVTKDEVTGIQADFSLVQDEVQSIRASLTERLERVQQQGHSLEQLQHKLDQAMAEKAQLRAQLETGIEKKEHEQRDMMQALEKLGREIETYKAECRDLGSSDDRPADGADTAEADPAAGDSETAGGDPETERADALRSELAGLQKVSETYRLQLAELQAQLDEAARQRQLIELEKKCLQERLQQQQRDKDDVSLKMDALCSDTNSVLTQLREENAELRGQVESERSRAAELATQLAAVETDRKRVDRDIADAGLDKDTLAARIALFKQQLKEQSELIDCYKYEISTLKTNYDSLESEVKRQEELTASLRAVNVEIDRKLNAEKELKKNFEEKLNQTLTEVAQLQCSMQELRAKNASLEEQLVSARAVKPLESETPSVETTQVEQEKVMSSYEPLCQESVSPAGDAGDKEVTEFVECPNVVERVELCEAVPKSGNPPALESAGQDSGASLKARDLHQLNVELEARCQAAESRITALAAELEQTSAELTRLRLRQSSSDSEPRDPEAEESAQGGQLGAGLDEMMLLQQGRLTELTRRSEELADDNHRLVAALSACSIEMDALRAELEQVAAEKAILEAAAAVSDSATSPTTATDSATVSNAPDSTTAATASEPMPAPVPDSTASACDTVSSVTAALEEERSRLSAEFDALQLVYENTSVTLEETTERLRRAEDDKAHLRRVLDNQREEMAAKTEEFDERLQEYLREITNKNEEIAVFLAELKTNQDEMADARAEVDRMQELVRTKETALRAVSGELAAAKTRLHTECERFLARESELARKLQEEKERFISQLTEVRETMRTSIDTMQAKIQQLNGLLKSQDLAHHVELSRLRCDYEQRLEALQQALAALRSQCDHTIAELIASHRRQLDELSQQLERTRLELEQLATQRQQCFDEAQSDADARLSAVTAEHRQAMERLQSQHEASVRRLRDEYEQRVQQLSCRAEEGRQKYQRSLASAEGRLQALEAELAEARRRHQLSEQALEQEHREELAALVRSQSYLAGAGDEESDERQESEERAARIDELQSASAALDSQAALAEDANRRLAAELAALQQTADQLHSSASLEESSRQVVRSVTEDCELRLREQEQAHQRQVQLLIGKAEDHEGHLTQQHRERVRSLYREIDEKVEAIDLTRTQLKEREDQLHALRDDYQQQLEQLRAQFSSQLDETVERAARDSRQELDQLQHQLETERRRLDEASRMAAAAVETGTTSLETIRKQVLAQHRQIELMRKKHKREVAELRRLLELQHLSVPAAAAADGEQAGLDPHTEMEYLRNILFEYMMGKEPLTLAKVISAVLKFSSDQTAKVLEKEQHRQAALSPVRPTVGSTLDSVGSTLSAFSPFKWR
ncbi:golgin subfamily A member 4-like isoform X5 [Amphibalanus amphitrite]|uniref:golgin subfamily A member 4-like isoform X5 n=1 Tax=Amphibalanus amphitrite TaxID=1232801 RepID=UPI001C9296B9|nr:golgin subfamily A member 4-like isoform X5 [Amphibalanus amphitrite]